MRTLRWLPPFALLTALTLAGQTPQPPQSRLQRGFASLSQGSWGHALAEWNQDGMLSEERLEAARAALEQLAPQPRSIGEWGPVQPPLVQRLWQRHWAMATFERTAVFLALDFVWHKGEWRLLKVAASHEPRELLPNLDAGLAARDRN